MAGAIGNGDLMTSLRRGQTLQTRTDTLIRGLGRRYSAAHKADLASVRADPKANPTAFDDCQKTINAEITDLSVVLELGSKAPAAASTSAGG